MNIIPKNNAPWLATISILILVPLTSILGVFYSFAFVIAGLSASFAVFWIANSAWVGAVMIISADLLEIGYHFPGLPLTLAKLVTAVASLGLLFFYLKKKGQNKFRFSKLDLIIFLLCLITSLSSIYNNSFSLSNSKGIFRLFSFLIVYFFISRSLINKQQVIRILFFIIFASSILLLFQCFEYLSRVEGLYENFGKNTLAAQLAISAILALVLATDIEISRRKRLLMWFTGGLYVFAIFINSSRGVVVAFLAAMAFVFISHGKKRIAFIIGLTILVMVAGLVAQALPKSEYSNSLTRLMNTNNIEQEKRIRIWKAGWMLIQNNPLLGIGYGNFSKVVGDYSLDSRINAIDGHSMYITTASESGLIAFLLFTGILVYAFYKINAIKRILNRQQQKSEIIYLWTLQAGLIFYGVNGIFLDTQFEADFWIFLGIIQSFILLNENKKTGYAYQDAQTQATKRVQSGLA